jgi:glutathione-regulated potassium-efflux system protein KefB
LWSVVAGGLTKVNAIRLGIVLAAGGEFAFVVFKIGRDQGCSNRACMTCWC